MKEYYIYIYNKLIELARNKALYKDFKSPDLFSDRLTFFYYILLFFLKLSKIEKTKLFSKKFMIFPLDS